MYHRFAEAAKNTAATKARIFGTDVPDVERIKAELVTLGPILQLEVVREPEGPRTT
jgi:hypothetical protein